MEYNFGSEGFWRALGCMALIGVIALAGFIAAGIIWVIKHVIVEAV